MEELLLLVGRQLGCPDVKPEQRFYDDLGAASIDLVHLVVLIEEKTGLFIPEEVIPELETSADLFTYIQQRLSDEKDRP